jgi:Secretion system C-terminal sorting domain/SprB repeat/Ig-like domain CHU_C associated/Right handed beta helix region/Periplasmic copper-binding protein (NosD)
MKKFSIINRYAFLISIFVTLFCFLSLQSYAQVTAGHHTVGPNGTFKNLGEVRDTLEGFGIVAGTGDVFFDIEDGTHDWGQITIDQVITNVDSDSRIIFQSESMVASACTLQTTSANCFFYFTDADYITVQHLTLINNNIGTYARGFYLNGTASNITIKHTVFWGYGSPTTSDGYAYIKMNRDAGPYHNLVVDSNEMNNGTHLVYLHYYMDFVSTGGKIRGNVVNGNGGLSLDLFDGVEISGNTFNFNNCDKGVWLVASDQQIKIYNNKIHVTNSSYGILLETCLSPAGPGASQIYNNTITMDGATETRYGIRLYNSQNLKFYHNSVNVAVGNGDSYGFYTYGGSDAGIILANNIFSLEGSGKPIGSEGTAITSSDYNCFYTRGNYFCARAGTGYNSLSDWQTQNSSDANSIVAYPHFISSTDLHAQSPWVDGGNNLSGEGITDDIDGTTRTNYDMGAYEFEPANTAKYNGTINVDGGGGGDFTTIEEAVDSLFFFGTSGAVTVSIANGTYGGQMHLKPIPRDNPTDVITFESATGDSNLVILEREGTTSGDDWFFYMDNCPYVTINQLTFNATGSDWARIIAMNGYARNITVQNCIFNGSGAPENTNNRTIIVNYTDDIFNFTADNNQFNNGSRGIWLEGISKDDRSTGASITNNEFNGHRQHIYIRYHHDFDIANNICDGANESSIKLNECYSPYNINNNEISTTQAVTAGIFLEDCIGSGQEALIFNNFIIVENDAEVRGIYIDRCYHQNFYFNSVNIISSNTASAAFRQYLYYTYEIGVSCKNNVFNVVGPGYPLYIYWGDGLFTDLDYNNYYTLGSHIAYWRHNNAKVTWQFSSISELNANVGWEENGQNFNPVYTSDYDLHADSYWMDNKGTPVAGITKDIDGNDRDITNPDIGADEYTTSIIPLSGPYTIDASGSGDYLSFNEAVEDLKTKGVTDHVIFNVKEGSYSEQVEIPSIAGTGASATITFQSDAANTNSPILNYVAAGVNDNYVMRLSGADYITIKGLRFQTGTTAYSNLIVLSGSTNNITIDGNELSGRSTGSRETYDAPLVAFDALFNDLLIQNNTISNGSFGLYLRATDGNRVSNLQILKNNITAFYHGMVVQYCEAPIIDSNYIKYTYEYNNSANGIQLDYCNNSSSAGMQITNNEVYSTVATTGGIYMSNCGETETYTGLIANNVISVGSYNSNDVSYGICLHLSDYKNIFNNSVNLLGNEYGDRGLSIGYSSYITAKNNIIACKGDLENKWGSLGYAVYFVEGSNFTSDHNNFFTTGRYFGNWLGTDHTTFDAYKNVSGTDDNSSCIFPAFIGVENLRTQSYFMNRAGTPLPEVTLDIEGNNRDATNPDLGAYEYDNTVTPLSDGTYTLGFGGDFESFDALRDSLNKLGIQGPTVINVLDGIYSNVSLALRKIPGTSPTDTIVIQSQSGDPTKVSVSYVQDINYNAIVVFNGTEYLTLKDMSFIAGGTGSYSTLIWMDGYNKDINILNNIFTGQSASGSFSWNKTCIYLHEGNIVEKLNVSGNTFDNNSNGIAFSGMHHISTDIYIANNTFTNQYRGIYTQKMKGIKFIGNTISDFTNCGLYYQDFESDAYILANNISTTNNTTNGIFLEGCDATPAAYGLIANNILKIGSGNGGYDPYGIRLETCTYQRVFHNTVWVDAQRTGCSSFRCINGENNQSFNNIFIANLGYAVNISGAAPLSNSNNNAIYTKGDVSIRWYNTYYSTLEDFQAESSYDANSLDTFPKFTSDNDLHLMDELLMGLGSNLTPVTSVVTTDIDGQPRDVLGPDIGADELHCESITISMADTTVCQFQPVVVRDKSTEITEGSIYYWNFDGAAGYEDTTYTYDTVITYAYQTAGTFTANVMVHQLGGCENNVDFEVVVNPSPVAPTVSDTIACIGSYSPTLIFDGDNVKWYDDAGLTILLDEGDSLETNITTIAEYDYYVTQTTGVCESPASKIMVKSYTAPNAPVAESYELCFGDTIPTLSSTGENVKWYADSLMTTLLFSANDYNPAITVPGNYTYYVTQSDTICFSKWTPVDLIVNPSPETSGITSDIDCEGNPYGSINLSVTGGVSPYFFEWSNGATSEDVTQLESGKYYVTVDDLNNCISIDSFNILEPPPMILTMITNDANCGEANGDVTVSVAGGEAPFEFYWNIGDSVASIDELISGSYFVTVTDNNGCNEAGIASINDLGGPTITITSKSDVTCYGLNNGAINVDITGGVTPYDISWSNGETTASISELVAGPYVLTVEDADGCKSIQTINILEPDPLFITLDLFDANCGQNNGKASAIVSGGIKPYTYIWQNGASYTDEYNNLGLGVYHIEVIDSNSCNAIKSFAISEIGSPTIAMDSLFEGTCGNKDGAIYISVYGTFLDYAYLWSNDSTTQDIVGIDPGEYSVTVTDSANCRSAEVFDLAPVKPDVIPICIVTVDTASNFNEIVWEKPETDNIDHFNIYKESTQSDLYLLAGSWPYDSLSIFVDSLSDSHQRSARYKLSVVDKCGIESELSSHHKTMHLTMTYGLGDDIVLRWDHYEGFDIATYYIHRYTSTSGWELYDSIQSNLTSYTDNNPPANDNLFYFIEVINPDGCTATKATNRNNSRSNVGSISSGAATAFNVLFIIDDGTDPVNGAAISFDGENTFSDESGESLYENKAPGSYDYTVTAFGFNAATGTVVVENEDITQNVTLNIVSVASIREMNNLLIYPNPNTGSFFINTEIYEETDFLIKIYNLQGQIITTIKEQNVHGKFIKEINLDNRFGGVYYLQIVTNSNNIIKKVIIR